MLQESCYLFFFKEGLRQEGTLTLEWLELGGCLKGVWTKTENVILLALAAGRF
jgi:hypothetical protein